MGTKVEFTEEKVKEYLDMCIRYWREKIKGFVVFGEESSYEDVENRDMANHYIDAYQSVRMSLFGELLL